MVFTKSMEGGRLKLLCMRNTMLDGLCGTLRAENAILKDDIAQMQQTHNTLQKKFFRSHSLAYQMTSRITSLGAILVSEQAVIAKQRKLGGPLLRSVLLFTHFVRISARRIRLLSADYRELKSRFVTLFLGHLALRRRYLDLERICVDSRLTAKRLGECLERAQTAKDSLIAEKDDLIKSRDSLVDELRSAQSLSWTVVSRYDALQTVHSELTIQVIHLKSDCLGFRDDLRQIATQVQEAFEITELGLNDLHKHGDGNLFKFKQDLLKTGHKLDLLRLSVTELLTGMTVVCAPREDGEALASAPPAYTPGSMEDALRRVKTLSENNEDSKPERFVPS